MTPRNLWNLLVQTSAIAVMSTGMVLIIVMRHIDLSVGSMLSFIGVVTRRRAGLLACRPGSARTIRSSGSSASSSRSGTGALLGAFNGFLVAYAGIPSFIVTLGGLIVYNGAAWWVIRGETVAPMDSQFRADRRHAAGRLDRRDGELGARRASSASAIVVGIFAQPLGARAFQIPAAADLGGGVSRSSSAAR